MSYRRVLVYSLIETDRLIMTFLERPDMDLAGADEIGVPTQKEFFGVLDVDQNRRG